MNKILLVYEDYAELMSVEATLKKVGFDVVGISNEYSMAEQILAFNPDLVVGSGRGGGKVSSLGVGKRLKEMLRWQGKVILLFPANFKPTPQDLIRIRVDMVLESPVAPLRLMQVIGRLLGHEESVLLERLNKSMHAESPQKMTIGGAKFNTDNEAIYIRGQVPEESSFGSLAPERIDEASGDVEVGGQKQKEKFLFKFGDRVSSAEADEANEATKSPTEEAFPDVDLKALERELLGGGAPEVERIETVVPEEIFNLESPSVDEELQARALKGLEQAQEGLANRVSKYSQVIGDLKVSPQSTVTRVEARRRQKQLREDLGEQNLNELDELRREFTKALFKK